MTILFLIGILTLLWVGAFCFRLVQGTWMEVPYAMSLVAIGFALIAFLLKTFFNA